MSLRRRTLGAKLAAVLAVLTMVGASCATPPPAEGYHTYKSTTLTPPKVNVVGGSGATGDGLLLTSVNATPPGTPRGFTIYDDTGEPVWYRPDVTGLPVTADLKVVDWDGQPALVMYEGQLFPGELGVSEGSITVLDSSYEEIGVFSPQYSPLADLHDVVVTATSLFFLIYDPVTVDMSAYGGSATATVYDAVIQEIDRATDTVVWEWHSLDHIPVTETVLPLTLPTIDYLHVNSLELDGNGNLLMSARTADALYMVDMSTDEVLWKLGGNAPTNGTPQLAFTNDGGFYRQHDARILPDGSIGLFDNGLTNVRDWSRGVRYTIDTGALTATMVQELRHSPDIYGNTMGNVDWLPNGNALVGWGTGAGFTEYDAAGNVVLDAEFPLVRSYRTVRSDWVGTPSAPPDAIVWPGAGGATDIFMSWNGSTETTQWKVEGGDPGNMTEIVTVPKDGFETQVSLTTTECDFAITPLDSAGNPLTTPLELGWSAPWTCPSAA